MARKVKEHQGGMKGAPIPHRMNILVVDDDPGIRIALSKLIARSDHGVTTAADGCAALQCLAQAQTPFDLVITDHMMAGMSGSEFVRQLRAICLSVKVIVFSAHVSPDDERRYRDLDVKKMLTKPFGIKELSEILNALAKLSPQAHMFFWLDHATVRNRR